MEGLHFLVLGAAALFIGGYYVRYFNNIKKAGGRAAAGRIYWREQFGLPPDEDVVSMGVGQWYLGPLVPETMRSAGQQVMDFLTQTSYRGALLWVGFTTRGRLALSVEPTDDGPRPLASSVGIKGYAPLAVFGEPRPRIELAAEAWLGSDKLPKPGQKPKRANLAGRTETLELIRLTAADGGQMTFFVEPGWIAHLQAWSRGGPVYADPQWTQGLTQQPPAV